MFNWLLSCPFLKHEMPSWEVTVRRLNGNSCLTVLCFTLMVIFILHFLFHIFSIPYKFSVSDYRQGVTAPICLSLLGKKALSVLYTHSSHKCDNLSLAQPWEVQRTCLFYPRFFKYFWLAYTKSIINIWASRTIELIFCSVDWGCHKFPSYFYLPFLIYSGLWIHLSGYDFGII